MRELSFDIPESQGLEKLIEGRGYSQLVWLEDAIKEAILTEEGEVFVEQGGYHYQVRLSEIDPYPGKGSISQVIFDRNTSQEIMKYSKGNIDNWVRRAISLWIRNGRVRLFYLKENGRLEPIGTGFKEVNNYGEDIEFRPATMANPQVTPSPVSSSA